MSHSEPTALIAGVGPGLGAALCRELAEAGYQVVGLARNRDYLDELTAELTSRGLNMHGIACDLTRQVSIERAMARVRQGHAPVNVYIHNASQLVHDRFIDLDLDAVESLWRTTCLSAFQFTQAIVPNMLENGEGTILFTGATASLRGGAKFAAFASAKFALRGLAQSLAREYGPLGIHVAHIIIDGIIDCDWTRERFGVTSSTTLNPRHIAQNYLHLIRQHRSAWTHELDLRPDVERF